MRKTFQDNNLFPLLQHIPNMCVFVYNPFYFLFLFISRNLNGRLH